MSDRRIEILLDDHVVILLGVQIVEKADVLPRYRACRTLSRTCLAAGSTCSLSSSTSRRVTSYSRTASSTSIWACRSRSASCSSVCVTLILALRDSTLVAVVDRQRHSHAQGPRILALQSIWRVVLERVRLPENIDITVGVGLGKPDIGLGPHEPPVGPTRHRAVPRRRASAALRSVAAAARRP